MNELICEYCKKPIKSKNDLVFELINMIRGMPRPRFSHKACFKIEKRIGSNDLSDSKRHESICYFIFVVFLVWITIWSSFIISEIQFILTLPVLTILVCLMTATIFFYVGYHSFRMIEGLIKINKARKIP